MHEPNQQAPKATKNTKATMSEVENIQAEEEVQETTQPPKVTQPKAKKAKTEKSEKSKKEVQADKLPPNQGEEHAQPIKSSQPRIKRGPARPHRRLAVDVIDSRITKLQKRLDRARSQTDDAARHVEGYLRERDFRAKEV